MTEALKVQSFIWDINVFRLYLFGLNHTMYYFYLRLFYGDLCYGCLLQLGLMLFTQTNLLST
jgi:hypothetical protein